MEPTTRLGPHERVLRSSRWVNLMRGWEGVGGRLRLTTERLLFEPHRFNVQTGTAEIPLGSVVGTEVGWTRMGGVRVAPNTFFVRTREGRTYQFISWSRRAWVRAIDEQRRAPR